MGAAVNHFLNAMKLRKFNIVDFQEAYKILFSNFYQFYDDFIKVRPNRIKVAHFISGTK